MARPAKALPTPADDGFNPERLEEAGEAAKQLAVIQSQQEATVRAVAAQLGYQLPADCTDPDLIQRDIAANMRRSVEACLEVGRGLRVLKEACPHGQFLPRLDVLGLDAGVAQKFMQAATKFANASTSRHLTDAIGNQSKLFEMLVLDDEQIEELELTGQTGELKLDDIATMSVKELRQALREAREDAEAQSKLLASKNNKIDELTASSSKRQRVSLTDWPAEFQGFINQVVAAKKAIEVNAGALDIIRTDAMSIEAAPGEEAALEKARESLGLELSAAITRAEECIAAVRHVFDKTLGALIEE